MTSSPARIRRPRARRLLTLLTAGLLLPVPALLGGPTALAQTEPLPGPPLPTYELVDLGRAPVPVYNNNHGNPGAVGDGGHVVGTYSGRDGHYYGWSWHAGTRTDRGRTTRLEDVDTRGTAVGYNHRDTAGDRLWTGWLSTPTGGSFLPLHDPDGVTAATGLNDAGTVVGWSDPYGNEVDDLPVKWESGRVVELPQLPGQYSGQALAVNQAGTILGSANTDDFDGAVLWDGDALRTIPDMHGPHDLADSGLVLGRWYDGTTDGWVRWKDGAIDVLEPLPGASYVNGHAINSAGDVVGDSGGEAALWPAGSTTPVAVQQLVPDPAYDIGQIADVNDAGWIVGSATREGIHVPILLRPVAQPPYVSDLTVEQRAVPSGEWVDVPAEGTIDGNTVRVAATVTNREATAKQVKLFVSVDDDLLTDTPLTATVPANGTATLTHEWDTTGMAWEHSRPAPDRTVEVRLLADNQEAGTRTVDLHVRPRPLVLVHGFNATAATWSAYDGVVDAVRPDWGVYAVGDGQAPGVMNTGSLTSPTAIPRTIVDNAETMAGYVDGVRDLLDAQSVDVVAHSMGGLISRQYVESFMGANAEGENVANQLIMLGTPNQGSPCASLLPLAGMYELRPEVVAEYNARMPNAPGVPMSVLAGNALSFTCNHEGWGDGVVAVPSAITGYPDNAQVGRIHTAITGGIDFRGFVLPRLIRGAGGGDPAALRALSAAQAPSPQLLGTHVPTVSAAAPVEIPVEVGTAEAFGASLVAPAHVTATLVAPDGTPAAVSSDSAGQPITTVRAATPATGRWTVRLTSTQAGATTVPLSVWVSGSPVSLDLAPVTVDAYGKATVTAALTDGGAPVAGATVTAQLRPVAGGNAVPVTLTSAGNGRYAGTSTPLTSGRHLVEVTSTHAGGSRSTLGSIEVGAVLPEPQPPAPSKPGKGCGPKHDRPASLPTCPPQAGGSKR